MLLVCVRVRVRAQARVYYAVRMHTSPNTRGLYLEVWKLGC